MGFNEIVIFTLIKMFDSFLHLTQLGSDVFLYPNIETHYLEKLKCYLES